jgi:crotonobetainyl-CoA:carnitine CoA-transferase CaiB-like acyl-CoA transferase
VEKSDIVIESFAGGVIERLGIDYETLRSINPKIIYCSVSGYGRSGPMKDARGYDLILQAFSGILSMTGHPGSGPTRVPLSPIDQAP